MKRLRLKRSAQTMLPAEWRRQLNLEDGDYLEAAAAAGGILLTPIVVFRCCLADAIPAGTVQRPLTPRLQQCYVYTVDDVDRFKATLRGMFVIRCGTAPSYRGATHHISTRVSPQHRSGGRRSTL